MIFCTRALQKRRISSWKVEKNAEKIKLQNRMMICNKILRIKKVARYRVFGASTEKHFYRLRA